MKLTGLPLNPALKGLEARGARVAVDRPGTYVTLGPSGFEYRTKTTPGPESSRLRTSSAQESRIDAELCLERGSLSGWYFAAACLSWLLGCLLGPWGLLLALVGSFAGAIPFTRWNRERRTARFFYDVDNTEVVERLAIANIAGRWLAGTRGLWQVPSTAPSGEQNGTTSPRGGTQRIVSRCVSGPVPFFDLNIEVACVLDAPQQLLFLPDRILVWDGKRLAAISHAELRVQAFSEPFVESGRVPEDARPLGTTWRHVKKDGQRDVRYADNAQLPVVEYGVLVLEGDSSTRVVLQTSNAAAAQGAATALLELVRRASPNVPADLGPQRTDAPRVVATTVDAPRSSLPTTSPRPTSAPTPTPTPAAVLASIWSPGMLSSAAVSAAKAVASPLVKPAAAARSTDKLKWVPPGGQPILIHGFVVTGGNIYVGGQSSAHDGEPSALVDRYPVDRQHPARSGEGMTYWPAYASMSPACRAAYLEWLVSGRSEPQAYIGYVFLYFYGLERRVLVDRADVEAIRGEVRRLLTIYWNNNSFRSYSTSFLALTSDVSGHDAQSVRTDLEPLVSVGSRDALIRLVTWYVERGLGLPSHIAALLAESDERATRSVVVTRAREELERLFEIRYQAKFGAGLVLSRTRKATKLAYLSASAALRSTTLSVNVTPVFERLAELKQLVAIWNESVEDLRKFSSAQRKSISSDAEVTLEMWEAMPPELRSTVDHPRLEGWTNGILAAPRCGPGHRVTASGLATMAGLEVRDKYTAGQTRRMAEVARQLGFVLEPDPRFTSTAASGATAFVAFRSDNLDVPDERVYGAASTITRLAMHIALADGSVDESELVKVADMVEELFVLDTPMRERMAALRNLLTEEPAKLGPLTKKLAESQSTTQRSAIGRLLVAVAAADGILHPAERKALQTIFKGLALPVASLDQILTSLGIGLDDDAPVIAAAGAPARKGSAVRAPDDAPEPRGVRLDPKAIEAILADTREVAAMLHSVLGTDEESSEPNPIATTAASSTSQTGSDSPAEFLGLSPSYHGILRELLQRPKWSTSELRELTARHNAMPVAVLDTINEWADEHLGDVLISEDDGWTIRQDLA